MQPLSGVRQGCPLSPLFFGLFISPIIHKLSDVLEYVQVLLYADDLIIIVKCDPAEGVKIFILVWAKVQEFSTFSGLHTNLDKSNILLQGRWDATHRLQLLSTGLKIAKRYKYLGDHLRCQNGRRGVRPNAVKGDWAFSMQSWAMSLEERVELLQSWMLPLLVYPARILFRDENVIWAIKTIHNIALKLNSWGITTDIPFHPKDQGEMDLAPPPIFLCCGNFPPFLCAMYARRRFFRCV